MNAPQEAVIDPGLEIVDAHHHLWRTGTETYLVPEFAADLASGHAVRRTVFVEWKSHYDLSAPPALQPVGETRFAAAAGRGGGIAAGIVGFADLTLGDAVQDVLEAHLAAGEGRFRGVRHVACWDDDAEVMRVTPPGPRGLYRDAGFRAGFAHLGPLGLSFDAWLFQTQLDDLTDLARRFPDQPIVLNHCGGILGIGRHARDRAAGFAAWRAALAGVANCPNVFLKIGGFGMPRTGLAPAPEPGLPHSQVLARCWRPWITAAIELFGSDRVMMESNFPVDRRVCDYRTLWNAMKRAAAFLTDEEKAAVFGRTAARFYRLPEIA